MKKPSWVVFDVGDVLLNWQASSAKLADYLNIDRSTLLDALYTYADDMFVGKISPTEGWAKILAKLKIEKDPWDMVLRWRDKAFWFEDTLSVVRELHSQGYQLAIMSNSWLGLTEKRDNDQLPKELKLFKHIFDSSQAGMKKPDERFYELVESGLKSTGNDIMLVDDSLNNAVPASKRGWQFFHYVTENDACAGSTQKLRALLK